MRHTAPEQRFFDESGKSIAFLDNATIVNACSILTNPKKFDVYKLLDLDSFFQAVLFNDGIRSLVGSSFLAAVRRRAGYSVKGGDEYSSPMSDLSNALWMSREDPAAALEKLNSPRSEFDTRSLYEELMGAGILRPVERSAGGLHYFVENHEKLDAIARSIDTDELISLHQRVFEGGIPWLYDIPKRAYEGEWNVERQAYDKVAKKVAANRAAASRVTYGEDNWISDSYPIYSFPDPSEKGKREFEESQRRFSTHTAMGPRKWGVAETFASQAFYYVVEANLQHKPYICSSVRGALVANMVSQLNARFRSSAAACLNSVDAHTGKQIEEAIEFLGDSTIRYVSAPALFLVFREAKNKSDIFPALFRLRDSSRVVKFRAWCRNLQEAWRQHDIGQISRHIATLDSSLENLTNSEDECEHSIRHLGNLKLLLDKTNHANPKLLEADCYSPSLIFLKDVGSTLMQPGRNRQLLEDLLQHQLTDADIETTNQLLALRKNLYPQGISQRSQKRYVVNNLEVNMGDTIKNVTNSTIVNRSNLTNAFNGVSSSDVEDILGKVSELVRASQNRSATELFEQFKEELAKPEPKKSILNAAWDGLVKVVPAIGSLAGAASSVAKLLS